MSICNGSSSVMYLIVGIRQAQIIVNKGLLNYVLHKKMMSCKTGKECKSKFKFIHLPQKNDLYMYM